MCMIVDTGATKAIELTNLQFSIGKFYILHSGTVIQNDF